MTDIFYGQGAGGICFFFFWDLSHSDGTHMGVDCGADKVMHDLAIMGGCGSLSLSLFTAVQSHPSWRETLVHREKGVAIPQLCWEGRDSVQP
jgi:hypothetical protein